MRRRCGIAPVETPNEEAKILVWKPRATAARPRVHRLPGSGSDVIALPASRHVYGSASGFAFQVSAVLASVLLVNALILVVYSTRW